MERGRRKSRILTQEMKDHIVELFYRGYTALEIQQFLQDDGVRISYSHLRSRIMPGLGLRKRQNRPPAIQVAEAVREVTADGALATASTSAVTRALRVERNMNVVRTDVAQAQLALDPQGVAERRTGRLHRRAYTCEGPNAVWHIDGYDKLSPFGLHIHGGIDGFVLWLEVGTTNRRPELTCLYFMTAVSSYCLPGTIRMDAGTENKNIEQCMRFLCADLPRVTPRACVLRGSSNHNERIERFWGLFRKQYGNFLIHHFRDLVRQGHITAWDKIDRTVSYYVFNELVRADLNRMKQWHNDHRIRKQNMEGPTGKPTHMYRCPQEYDHYECGRTPDAIKYVVAQREKTADIPFDHDFNIILTNFVNRAGMAYPPANVEDATRMYIELRREAHAALD